jgi:hypothetical protein
MAGLLAFSKKSAFPITQWLVFGLLIMEMTVAGTAQDSHLIPFYALVKHQYITKSSANLRIFSQNAKFISFFFVFSFDFVK